ncbi:hypothetical protein AB0M91_19725 [Micromonospora rifamycinica]|uniref:hypothetical protein n=1 Tax=Micromonospora rifamycinica TaxID=291594 RepID=UPI00341A88E1
MSPRQALAALIHRPATGPDEIEQWVDGLRPTAPTGGLTALASTAPIDTAAVRALTDTSTREEQA